MGRKLYHSSEEKRAAISKNARAYQRKNPDKVRAAHIKRTYGLSWEDYLLLYASQEGTCAICKVPLSLYPKQNEHEVAHVDHCHVSGKVRGLLCKTCNSGLGNFKETALLCKLAAKYLEEK